MYCRPRRDVGKTEITIRLFNKLKTKYKVCILDLDFRKKGLTKDIYGETNFKNYDEFNQNKSKFLSDNDSIFIPSLDIDNPPDFFSSEHFIEFVQSLKNEYDYIICDTPPWKLFVDAKIISKNFDQLIYIVCNQSSSFKDLDLFLKETEKNKVNFFYNKFNLYFNFLWYKYQYPYYSRNYYYEYGHYSQIKGNSFINVYKRISSYLSNFLKIIFSSG